MIVIQGGLEGVLGPVTFKGTDSRQFHRGPKGVCSSIVFKEGPGDVLLGPVTFKGTLSRPVYRGP